MKAHYKIGSDSSLSTSTTFSCTESRITTYEHRPSPEKTMKSVWISNCVNDVAVARVPMRATYVNLYKWPESDAEFVRSVSSNRRKGLHIMYGHPTVVDSISCRQMFLRSYKFSRKESISEKTHKCFQKVKGRLLSYGKRKRKLQFRKRKCLVWRKLKAISCSALFRLLQRLSSCSARGHVV